MLSGDGGSIVQGGKGGDDVVLGGRGNDTLYGDCLSLREDGHAGDDTIFGDARTLVLDDYAPQGGDDTIRGSAGNDRLWGDFETTGIGSAGGRDRFVFAPGSSLDTINDFEHGKDQIDLRAYGVYSLAELTIENTGVDSVIDLDGRVRNIDEITVLHVTRLVASDFIFA